MRLFSIAVALAFCVALVPVGADAAITIHFEVVNQRGETVTVEGAPCSGLGKTSLESGKSLGADCSINVGGQTALQVRTIGGAGVICWPHAVAMSEYRIDAGTIEKGSCSFEALGGNSYRFVLAGASYFNIHLKNERTADIMITNTNYNCKPVTDREARVAAGGGVDWRCFRADFNTGSGITIQARVPNNTRDLICQAWWHERKTFVFHGSCPISQTGPDDYVLAIK